MTNTTPAVPTAKRAAPAKKSVAAKKSAAAQKTAAPHAAPSLEEHTPQEKPRPSATGLESTPATGPSAAEPIASAPSAATSGPRVAPNAEPADLPSSPDTSVEQAAGSAPAVPQSLPDFDTLTIPQLRTRLKTLRSPELNELISYEQAGRNRPAIIGMLRARLETLQK